MRLRPVTFEWKDAEQNGFHRPGTQKGFIAQEVEQVIPEWVGTNTEGFKTLDTRGIEGTAMLVDSIRALKFQNDELRDRVKSIEAGRRPLVSGFGEGGIGLGMVGIAGAIVLASRRRARSETRSAR